MRLNSLLHWGKALWEHWWDWRLRRSWWAGLEQRAAAISAQSLQGISRREDWLRQRADLRHQILWMLGLEPLPPRTPLAARTTGTLARENYLVEKVVFESLPGLWVTGNLYLPRPISEPVPCVLYLCGHQIHPLGAKTQYQDRVRWYPLHGIACMVLDSLLCGEAAGCHRGTHTLGKWDWLSLGYTPAGVEVWNALRALDYLQERPEIDGRRLGVTGTSGGGVMTWLVTALEDRVRVAAASASAYTVESQVLARLLPFQCDCTYFPNVYQLDFPEVAALIAPRPLLILAGKRDHIFPPEGYRRLHQQLRKIYDLYGAQGSEDPRLELVESNRGHAESPESLKRTYQWMARWLPPVERPESDYQPVMGARERPEDLACLAEIPPNLANFSIHHTFVSPPALAPPPSDKEWSSRREAIANQLKETVFRGFPEPYTIPCQTRRLWSRGGHARRFAHFSEWLLRSETVDCIRVQLYEPKKMPADAPLLITIKARGESWNFPDDELLPLLADHRVLIVAPRFSRGMFSPSELATIERAAALCGRTIAALQIWDVRRALFWSLYDRGMTPRKISVWGRREAGVIGLYAAFWEPKIDQVILQDSPVSHRQGPALLTILRTTDIPEVIGLIAPRQTTFLNPPPAGLHLAGEWYRRCGAADRLGTAPSLVAALRGGTIPWEGEE